MLVKNHQLESKTHLGRKKEEPADHNKEGMMKSKQQPDLSGTKWHKTGRTKEMEDKLYIKEFGDLGGEKLYQYIRYTKD